MLESGVSWHNQVKETDAIGKFKILKNLVSFDEMEWLMVNMNKFNIPKIIGFSIWYNYELENFRGLHTYYQGFGLKQDDQLHHMITDEGRWGRVTHMFADDEYV